VLICGSPRDEDEEMYDPMETHRRRPVWGPASSTINLFLFMLRFLGDRR
jgi:hypothetical protein